MIILWFAGLRGAIALILALTTDDKVIINSTYFIVLFTNI